MLSCPRCSRINPPLAQFCHHDGAPLTLSPASPSQRFFAPFVFPSGRSCVTFDELALACLDQWDTAIGLLRDGTLAAFLAGLGRADLAAAARYAGRFPDGDRGLDDWLRRLPAPSLPPPRLRIDPPRIELGRLRPGQDAQVMLRIVNDGKGLLHGSVSAIVPWLALGEGDGAPTRLFQCRSDTTLRVVVRGKVLRANAQPLAGQLLIESSGGQAFVQVTGSVPPVPFAAGILAGAHTPRQLAEKARLNPREAARLFESGAVARWYRDNGWIYPVPDGSATGLAAVQQFFDALGLTVPPRLQLSETTLTLQGAPGEHVLHSLRLWTAENRPVYARAVSDQPWLVVRGVDLDGSSAHIHLSVPAIPTRPGETLQANLTITGNGRQRFVVPVRLQVRPQVSPVGVTNQPPAGQPQSLDWLPVPTMPIDAPALSREWLPVIAPTVTPTIVPGAPGSLQVTHPGGRRSRLWRVMVPGVLLVLLGMISLIVALTRNPADEQLADGGEPAEREQKDHPPVEPQPHTTLRPLSSLPPPLSAIARPSIPEVPGIRPRHMERPTGPPEILLPDFATREVEVVFCIDTTGSMGGLLNGAKSKIWSMCNQIAGGRPTPQLKVGLVAYRDREDDYVTKVFDLNRNLDAIHGHLNELQATGGGDLPESVNQALDDSVNKIKWSPDRRTLKIIFLVGDAPPHMDYKDDVKYPETCAQASKRGILINTIQCGQQAECTRLWKDIAELAGGSYVSIPQTGGVVVIATPHDDPLSDLGRKILDTALIFGDEDEKRRGQRTLDAARRLKGVAAADRAAFTAKSKQIGPYDLIDAIKLKIVKLEELTPRELPEAMKDLKSLAERRRFLAAASEQRAKLFEKALELEKKRAAAIREKTDKGAGKDSFDGQVLELLRTQARKFDITY